MCAAAIGIVSGYSLTGCPWSRPGRRPVPLPSRGVAPFVEVGKTDVHDPDQSNTRCDKLISALGEVRGGLAAKIATHSNTRACLEAKYTGS